MVTPTKSAFNTLEYKLNGNFCFPIAVMTIGSTGSQAAIKNARLET